MAVADTEDRNAEVIDRRVHRRAGGLGDAGGSTRDDDAPGIGQLGGWLVDVTDDGVDTELSNPARDQVAVLPTGVQDDDLAHAERPPTAAAPASGPAGRPCPPS